MTETEGLVHILRPFNTSFQYIPSLERCGNDDCRSFDVTNVPNILANDTSNCNDEVEGPSATSPNVNDVTAAIAVLNTTIGQTTPERHWAYAAFYEPEGWTEDTAPMIKGVRHALAPLSSSSSSSSLPGCASSNVGTDRILCPCLL